MLTATVNHWKDTVYERIPVEDRASRAFWHCQRMLDETGKRTEPRTQKSYDDINLAAWQLVIDEDAGRPVLPLGGGLT